MIFHMTIRAVVALLAASLIFSTAAPASEPATQRAAPVKAGEAAPDFILTDQKGQRHILSAERGKRAVVLIFYRGYW
jgi:cytochrome oxidase Cu insertion factor (SCO1/SenC/PrrC family)